MEPISAAIAGLVALVGIAVVCIGLFADRSRGRRRCPACGYAMDGLESHDDPRRCPECGRAAKSERALYRTRRRPRRVVAGVLIVLLACAVAAWSRWEAVGPAGLPSPLLVRLTVLDRADIRLEIVRRIDEGLLDERDLRALAERLIADSRHADLSRSAFAQNTIDQLAFWSGARFPDDQGDPEPRRRVLAGVLGPFAGETLLSDPDADRRSRAVVWCEFFSSRSIEARHALLAAPADPDPGVAQQSATTLSRLDWMCNGFIPPAVARKVSNGRMSWLGERIARWVRDRPATPETMRTLAIHLMDAGHPDAGYLQAQGDAGVASGILMTTLGPTDEVFEAIVAWADPAQRGTEALTPFRFLAGFAWRDEMAPLVLSAIAHEHWEVRDAGWDVLEHFGPSARVDPDALLAVIRDPGVDAERRAPAVAAALGVARSALREAAIGVLGAQLAAWREQGGEPMQINGHEVAFGGGVVDWIDEVALRDEVETVEGGVVKGRTFERGTDDEVEALLRELVFETEPGLGCRAARAYLRVSGDGEGVTRFVLDAYARQNAREFDGAPRRTGQRITSAVRWLVIDPGFDTDAALEWVGEDEDRARRLARLCSAQIRVMDREARDNTEKLLTTLSRFERAREPATQVLNFIKQRSGEGDPSEPITP